MAVAFFARFLSAAAKLEVAAALAAAAAAAVLVPDLFVPAVNPLATSFGAGVAVCRDAGEDVVPLTGLVADFMGFVVICCDLCFVTTPRK